MSPVLGRRTTMTMGFLLLVASAVLASPGCAPVQQPTQKLETVRSEPAADAKSWEAGMRKFRANDLDNALIDFDLLKQTAQSERYARMASYASACTRLVLAQTTEEFSEAMKQWAVWSDGIPSDETEDPRMLRPLLDKIDLSCTQLLPEAEIRKQEKSKKQLSYKVELVHKDLLAYKNMVQAREKESERLKTRLDAKEREIRRLKQQIESLEAIHLKFQERQKEISSP
jgi:hypothetical protein